MVGGLAGEHVSSVLSRVAHTVGGGALGAIGLALKHHFEIQTANLS